MSSKAFSILVVDGDPAHAEAIGRAFQDVDPSVMIWTARTLHDYRQAIDSDPPDIAFVDLVLQDGGAIETLANAREAPCFPILVMTNHGDEQAAASAIKAGALDYVVKSPQVWDDIPHVVERAMREWRLREEHRLAEEALRESKARYRRITESVTDYVYTVRIENGRAVETRHGPGCEAITGHDSEDFAADASLWVSMVAEEDRPRVEEQARRLLRGEECPPIEHRIVRKDGALRWVRNTPVLHFDSVGCPASYDGLVRDVTEQKRIEGLLEKERQELKLIIDSSPIIVFYKDMQGRFIRVNKTFAEALQMPEEEFVGKTVFDLYSPDIAQGMTDDDQEVFRSGRPKVGIVERYESARGIRWVRTDKIPIHDNDGVLVGLIGFAQDITEHKRAEEELRKREQEFKTLAENAPDIIVRFDRQYRHVYVNPIVEQEFGSAPATLLGKTHRELGMPPDMADWSERIIRQVFETGKEVAFELSYPRGEGSRHYLSRGVPELASDGSIESALFIHRNITDRKRAEEALQASEQKFRMMADQAPIMIGVTDRTGNITFLNKTWLDFRGRTLEEEAGWAWAASLHPEDHDRVITSMESAIRAQKPYSVEYRIQNRAGDYRWILDTATPMLDSSEQPQGYIGTALDITERKQAETALRESEAQLANACKMAHLGPWEYDVEKDLFTFNDNFYAIFRTTAAQVGSYVMSSAEYAERFIHPDDRDVVVVETRKAIEATDPGFSRQLDHRIVYADGTYGYISVRFFIVKDDSGRTVRTYGVNQDITERKQAEAALRESGAQLANACKMAHLGPWEYDVEKDLFTFNDNFYAIFRTTAAQVGGYFMSSAEYAERFIHPDDRDVVVVETRKAIEATDPGFSRQLDHRIVYADGTHGYISVRFFIAKDDRGRTIRTYGVNQDITERKQVEEQLRILSAVIEQSANPVGIVDYRGIVQYMNPASLNLYEIRSEDVVGKPWAEMISAQATLREHMPEIRDTVLQRSQPWHGEIADVNRRGETVWREATVLPIKDAEQRTTHVAYMSTDITERKRAEAERLELERRLLHAQKLESLGVLAGGIAHDFNNLLMGILGSLDLAAQNLPGDSRALPDIEQAVQATRRATDLTRQMLAYSGKGSFEIAPVDLNALIQENAGLFRTVISRSITLKINISRSEPVLNADAGQVQQVIMNLITNAAEAIGDRPGIVTLTSGVMECDEQCLSRSRIDSPTPPGLYSYVEVADTGPGMNEETLSRLFDPFFTTKFTGRGLGMSAILGIVRSHGGAIMVDSVLGRGTLIQVLFPAYVGQRTASTTVSVSSATRPEVALRRGLILVVDDEESVRSSLQRYLEHHGYETLNASNGDEALTVFNRRTDEIACVVLDLTMPGMSGASVLREMKRCRPNLQIILTSGFNEDAAMRDFSEARPTMFIQKPYRLSALRATIERILVGLTESSSSS